MNYLITGGAGFIGNNLLHLYEWINRAQLLDRAKLLSKTADGHYLKKTGERSGFN